MHVKQASYVCWCVPTAGVVYDTVVRGWGWLLAVRPEQQKRTGHSEPPAAEDLTALLQCLKNGGIGGFPEFLLC